MYNQGKTAVSIRTLGLATTLVSWILRCRCLFVGLVLKLQQHQKEWLIVYRRKIEAEVPLLGLVFEPSFVESSWRFLARVANTSRLVV